MRMLIPSRTVLALDRMVGVIIAQVDDDNREFRLIMPRSTC
jgi:hypothetical protein